MTNEQQASLNRIRAHYAMCNYSSALNGTYSTEDMSILLNILENVFHKISYLKNDLEAVKTYLQDDSNIIDPIVISMIDSSLSLLNESEDFI